MDVGQTQQTYKKSAEIDSFERRLMPQYQDSRHIRDVHSYDIRPLFVQRRRLSDQT